MNKTIGLLLVSTGKYGQFLQPLIDGLEKNFFINNNVVIYLFTDRQHPLKLSERITVRYFKIDHKPFPHPTLKRYHFFSQAAFHIKADYVFYTDVDMAFVGPVDAEILPEEKHGGLVATLHPGFYNGGGAWGNDTNSKSFTPPDNRKKYYAGGFQGGETFAYMAACKELAADIADDESRGVLAEWHDETHWNRFLSTRTPKTLDPDYCMVEQIDLRVAWGINRFEPKIIALQKDHDALR